VHPIAPNQGVINQNVNVRSTWYQRWKSKIKSKLTQRRDRFKGMFGIEDMERHLLVYVKVKTSEQYNDLSGNIGKQQVISSYIATYFMMFWLFLYAFMFFLFAYFDETSYYQIILLPQFLLRYARVLCIGLAQFTITCSCMRLMAFILEQNKRFDGPWFIYKTLRSPNTHLNDNYYSKLAWQVELFGNYSANFIPKITTLWLMIILIIFIYQSNDYYINLSLTFK